MRIRTLVGILIALFLLVFLSSVAHQNIALLHQPVKLTRSAELPLWSIVLGVFLLGFLPPVFSLVVQTLKRDLAQRRNRRRKREQKSMYGSFRRAVDLESDGQWSRAAAELSGLLAERPQDFAALLRYGEVLRLQGKRQQALEVHRRASVLYPHSVALLYQLGEDYEALGEGEVAREIRDRILRDFPGLGLAILRRRRNHALSMRDWSEARKLQERIAAMVSEDDELEERELRVARGLRYQGGVELLEADRFEEAQAVFKEVLGTEPGFVPAAIMLGEAELSAGNDEQAVVEWRRGYERTGDPVFLQRLEDHYIERNDPPAAIETLRSLISQAENDLFPRFFLGRLYYRLEMHEEALKVFEELADRLESSRTFHYLVGRIHQRRGEMRKAVEAYLRCIEESGVTTTEFVCSQCRRRYSEWQDRCDQCGAWGAVELDLEEENMSSAELGVRPAPVWPVLDDGEVALAGDDL
ncbi:MAG TPA: tetratricopeptide repeat protein [Thermoanaerobaculia bacterium]|nr:tetratricopeptide repeat protein [Thermoanaerobaculia bacterium]